MIESIGLALVKSLVTYLFNVYVLAASTVKIDGAPGWYMQNDSANVCVYEYQHGGLESVDAAKSKAYPDMEKQLTYIIEAVIYDNYSTLKDPSEKRFVMLFKSDADAPVFVRKTLVFPAVEYNKKIRTAFVKACIDKNQIVEYQKGRLETIKYQLTHKRAGDAFDEMEKEDMKLE
jgi:hypothetical protein